MFFRPGVTELPLSLSSSSWLPDSPSPPSTFTRREVEATKLLLSNISPINQRTNERKSERKKTKYFNSIYFPGWRQRVCLRGDRPPDRAGFDALRLSHLQEETSTQRNGSSRLKIKKKQKYFHLSFSIKMKQQNIKLKNNSIHLFFFIYFLSFLVYFNWSETPFKVDKWNYLNPRNELNNLTKRFTLSDSVKWYFLLH